MSADHGAATNALVTRLAATLEMAEEEVLEGLRDLARLEAEDVVESHQEDELRHPPYDGG